jgi:hypothetical protein
LYFTKAEASLETTSEKKIKDMKGNNSYFDYDKFELKTAEKEESITWAIPSTTTRKRLLPCRASAITAARRSTTWNCHGTEPKQ